MSTEISSRKTYIHVPIYLHGVWIFFLFYQRVVYLHAASAKLQGKISNFVQLP